jgi:hypothetical protein
VPALALVSGKTAAAAWPSHTTSTATQEPAGLPRMPRLAGWPRQEDDRDRRAPETASAAALRSRGTPPDGY